MKILSVHQVIEQFNTLPPLLEKVSTRIGHRVIPRINTYRLNFFRPLEKLLLSEMKQDIDTANSE
jgi:hypothetical protein